jgi:tripartite-type tricarboxylate transporter receptor subunit TctC
MFVKGKSMQPKHSRQALALALTLVLPFAAYAQSFPSRPVRFVVPYAPGGNTDMMARTLSQKVTQNGHTVVVENRGGAATLIGSELVARSAADGYTILLATSTTLAINPHLYKKLPYDPLKDFAPVMLIGRTPMVLVVHPSLPAKNIKELIALARSQPGKLPYGTAGIGSPSFTSMAMFRAATKLDLIEVPYKGSGPADVDLLSGQIVMMFQNTAFNYIQQGRLRPIAHTGEKRMEILPHVPTLVESGIKDSVFYSWQGIVAPAAAPAEAIAWLNAEFNKALEAPDARARMTQDGAELFGGTPEQFAKLIRSEIPRMGKVLQATGVKPE